MNTISDNTAPLRSKAQYKRDARNRKLLKFAHDVFFAIAGSALWYWLLVIASR